MRTTAQRLEVVLKGNRNYVQGSQILGRAADWLLEKGHENAIIRSTKFTKITRNGVFAIMNNTTSKPDHPDRVVGEANYETGSNRFSVTFYEDLETQAPKVQDSPSRLTQLINPGGVNGEAAFIIDGSHESYIASVIETVKALHLSLGKDVTDIWFTALNKAQLPIAGFQNMSGTHVVSEKMTRKRGSRTQSLSNVETHCDGRIIAEFNIAFSCVVNT